jgi:hypothetical protein
MDIYLKVKGSTVTMSTEKDNRFHGVDEQAVRVRFPYVLYCGIQKPSPEELDAVCAWMQSQGYTVAALQHYFCGLRIR